MDVPVWLSCINEYCAKVLWCLQTVYFKRHCDMDLIDPGYDIKSDVNDDHAYAIERL